VEGWLHDLPSNLFDNNRADHRAPNQQ
jgi:hypothetical protein